MARQAKSRSHAQAMHILEDNLSSFPASKKRKVEVDVDGEDDEEEDGNYSPFTSKQLSRTRSEPVKPSKVDKSAINGPEKLDKLKQELKDVKESLKLCRTRKSVLTQQGRKYRDTIKAKTEELKDVKARLGASSEECKRLTKEVENCKNMAERNDQSFTTSKERALGDVAHQVHQGNIVSVGQEAPQVLSLTELLQSEKQGSVVPSNEHKEMNTIRTQLVSIKTEFESLKKDVEQYKTQIKHLEKEKQCFQANEERFRVIQIHSHEQQINLEKQHAHWKVSAKQQAEAFQVQVNEGFADWLAKLGSTSKVGE